MPFQTQRQGSPEGATVVQSFNYTAVGTYLRVRPHITNDKDVDLTINLQLSSIVPGQTEFGNFIFDRRETTTHVIMRDGETVMLSGIVQQQDSMDVRKLPILGDLPLIGVLFRSSDHAKSNRELIKPEALWEFDQARELTGAQFLSASVARTAFYQHMLTLFEQHDFLALPVSHA